MKISKKIIVTTLLLIAITMSGQKYELGKVTVAELEEKVHATDPGAEAAYLFRKGEVHFEYSQDRGFVMKTEVKAKIKIYSKEGYKWANHLIKYYLLGDSEEKVTLSDVATYNLVDGKVTKTKMKSDGVFDEKINKYWGNKKIALPNVKEGSIIEYSYIISSPNIGRLYDWDFQSYIPVNHSEFKTYIPEYFIYNPNQKGFIFPKVTTEKNNQSMSFSYREATQAGESIVKSTSQERVEFVETKTVFVADNLPGMKEEVFVNNIDNYMSSISHELSIIKYPNKPIKALSTDWETVVKKIYDYDDFGPELNKKGYFDDDITALVKGLTKRDEIIDAIFNYVKSNVKWNGYTGYSCNDGVKQAYKNKTGNVAEINLMLTAMLRFAGIDANPVLVSTRSNGITLFPSRTAFNYVISAVEIENALILLDATEKYAAPNILPERDLNWLGRLIRKEGSSVEVDLMPQNVSKENHNISYKINADGTVDGKLRKQYTDYKALNFRQTKMALTRDNYLEQLENNNNAIEVSEYVRENDTDIANPIIETYAFKDNRDIEIINDKIYVTPLLFLGYKENPFKLEKRDYPIDFTYPFQQKYLANIDVPEGYAIESLPKAVNMVTGEDLGLFKYIISGAENKIQVSITFEISKAIVGSEYYDVVKDFYQKVIDKENEKIVLVKIK
ncbi:DUF3857 domain-containing protein [Flavobacterium sp.]|uniref:DUF3857 domain-containing protein n=1 Tax=Flavobacterium sp. TaxID=239 RepID=UPI00262BED5E|nr:DUF3857 domain-containing protein [Flavobacterium sp.]